MAVPTPGARPGEPRAPSSGIPAASIGSGHQASRSRWRSLTVGAGTAALVGLAVALLRRRGPATAGQVQPQTPTDSPPPRQFGLGRGKVFPATDARSLINPLRHLVQSSRRTVAALQLASDAAVIEIGCGPGFFSPDLAAAVPHGRLVLLDLQPEMLQVARERLAEQENVAYVAGDAQSLPFAAAHFDAAFIATMLGEVPDTATCLEEVQRILRPGGLLAIAETRRDSDFIGLAELRALVEPRGFTFRSRWGSAWQYVACFTRGASTAQVPQERADDSGAGIRHS